LLFKSEDPTLAISTSGSIKRFQNITRLYF
jgi:hypothetical protein